MYLSSSCKYLSDKQTRNGIGGALWEFVFRVNQTQTFVPIKTYPHKANICFVTTFKILDVYWS